MSGDVFGSHDWGAPGTEWVGLGRLLRAPASGTAASENGPAPNSDINGAKEGERSALCPFQHAVLSGKREGKELA